MVHQEGRPSDEGVPPEVSPLYTLWSVQDTLLQYYRTMFITAESLLVAVAATVAASAKPMAWALVVAGVALLAVWSTLTRRRARDVQFSQQVIRWHEAGKKLRAPFTTFKRYQSEWPISQSFTVEFIDGSSEAFLSEGVWPPRVGSRAKFLTWSTRVQMEVVLPTAYLLSWSVICVYAAGWP